MDVIKKAGKQFVCWLLETQVRRLRSHHTFRIVAVGGSVGKTSTKLAIAKTLSATQRVRYQDGNYNDRITVPLVLFGHSLPALFNIFAWARILLQNELAIRRTYPVDIAVLEIGTDGPGQIAEFAYLVPDLAVVTAVTLEHMEFFANLDAVAVEELQTAKFAKKLLVNADDTPSEYLSGLEYASYGFKKDADYRVKDIKRHNLTGQSATFMMAGTELAVDLNILGDQGAKIALAAAAVADILGLSKDEIAKGLQSVASAPGRMQVLPGIQSSILIDDTYNSSPAAVKAALDVLYSAEASQRIAILGSMNELGGYAEAAHTEVGDYCDGSKLALVITIGEMANTWTAAAAETKGCKVEKFMSPYDAGEFVKSHMQAGAVMLAKGSQNGVFAEEALKPLLENSDDASKLVRQSSAWLAKKAKQFGR